MSDRIPGSSWSNPIKYRGYLIHVNSCNVDERCDWVFAHEDFDGASDAHDGRSGFGPTVEACKREIDQQIEDAAP